MQRFTLLILFTLLTAMLSFQSHASVCIIRGMIVPCEDKPSKEEKMKCSSYEVSASSLNCEPENMYFDQGRCEEPGEFEFSYCASEEMTHLNFVFGSAYILSDPFDNRVELMIGHESVVGEATLVKNCENARALIGQSKSQTDNRGGLEYGIPLLALSFECRD